jgi:hypothetical protein
MVEIEETDFNKSKETNREEVLNKIKNYKLFQNKIIMMKF